MFRRQRRDEPPDAASGAATVLAVLDSCAKASFPMLDHPYVYLAATRLSVFGDGADWALVIEVFGYPPRLGVPELRVATFGSRLLRDPSRRFVTAVAHQKYLQMRPYDESRGFYPIEDEGWIEPEEAGAVATDVTHLSLRGLRVALPSPATYDAAGIELIDPPRVRIFELCRALAATHRSLVLGTDDERRASVPPELPELLVLDEWHHPDLVSVLPSQTETFQQLAAVVLAADPEPYQPTKPANTHWSNWPEGGIL